MINSVDVNDLALVAECLTLLPWLVALASYSYLKRSILVRLPLIDNAYCFEEQRKKTRK